ncbi:MAG: heme exporter protein CcmB [Actinomycetota bacterium]|nr:heme exporter protein CcmB [Actinomycetota bacterium]
MKDLRSETRAKEVAPAMALFSLALVFIFSFALPPGAGRAPAPLPVAGAVSALEIAGTFLWTALLFASITGFGRTAAMEREGSRIESLLLAPIDPAAIFVGKAIANIVFMFVVEVVMLPVFVILLDIDPGRIFPGVLMVALGADVGLASIGTLFGAASQYARARALILPLLCFPVLLPIVLAAARLTSTLLITGTTAGQGHWFILMAAYDVIFATIGTVTYGFVVQE